MRDNGALLLLDGGPPRAERGWRPAAGRAEAGAEHGALLLLLLDGGPRVEALRGGGLLQARRQPALSTEPSSSGRPWPSGVGGLLQARRKPALSTDC